MKEYLSDSKTTEQEGLEETAILIMEEDKGITASTAILKDILIISQTEVAIQEKEMKTVRRGVFMEEEISERVPTETKVSEGIISEGSFKCTAENALKATKKSTCMLT